MMTKTRRQLVAAAAMALVSGTAECSGSDDDNEQAGRERAPDHRRQASYGVGTYAIPQASGPMGMVYRADLSDCTFPPGNSAWLTSLAWQAGAQWSGTDGASWTVGIDNAETRKATEHRQRMVDEWGDAILRGNAVRAACSPIPAPTRSSSGLRPGSRSPAGDPSSVS